MKPLLIALAALFFAAPALAKVNPVAPAITGERIDRFDVAIEVEQSGDIVVTETIAVTAQGDEIRRGIFRDLPRYYDDNGERLQFNYRVLSVTRDGAPENYDTDNDGNAYRIRIGDEDVLIEHGPHVYEIRYRVANQVRYFERYDEIYWNATGNYWVFPILASRVTVQLPPGAVVTQTAAYTGTQGAAGSAYDHHVEGDRQIFETTRALEPGEGLTISIGFEKGVVDPPSAADASAAWWQRYGALGILIATILGLFVFLYRSWDRVGRDPAKGPVFPRYEAPRGYSPAAVHYIYNRALVGNRALIATLMNLAVKGRLTIDAADKKRTVLTRTAAGADPAIPAEDADLERSIFASGSTKTLGGSVDSAFTTAYGAYQQKLGKAYGSPFFRWNLGYSIFALALTILLAFLALSQVVNWTIWHTIAIVALAAVNLAFMYLMPSATPAGQEARTEIEGFKLYLETAEKLALNATQPGSEAPPMMTKERYERFLPYAVALGVEAPWTKYFERVLPQEAENYHPTWGNMGSSRSIGALSSALVSNINSGVTSAMPQSSGSSGSGGGGSSGGGGGGGGGGGW